MQKRHILTNFISLKQLGHIRLLDGLPPYPFGMLIPGRNWSVGSEYRFGFNGQEQDDEVYGNGNLNTAMFWEYDTRLGRRWNIDPITYPWHSSYVVFNGNPIAFTDLLGLFGSRKEARTYKNENNLKGQVHKGSDGKFSIDNKKSNTSYFKDPSLDNDPTIYARQADGVIKLALVDPEVTTNPSTGNFMTGIGEFGNRGEKLTKTTTPLKSTGKIKFYNNNWSGNQYVKTSKVFSKELTKVAKKAPIIGYLMTASEIIDGVGTVVGGVIGGVLGSWGGEAAAESGSSAILNE